MSQPKKTDNSELKSSVLDTHDSESISIPKPTKPVTVIKSQNGSKKPFTERWKTHRFWLVRATYHILYSVWVVVMAIGTAIAWLIAMLFI